ncbi:alpha/beta hydrolase [Xanthomarina spongicola]|uniref:Putative esterase n=1 Tax=Xanthomarina spongicola TaxID=570520 RepID=A0A316DRE4_9FLAO|nr:esterase [Xanthomarina spongicola]PWK19729.1 putative esterase [Xanthomarina spongicola]
MNLEEKEISYTTTNSYATINTLTDKTKNIWFVCHGMGFLSRYFLRYFSGLNADENYVIAPQAQSKYYIPPKFKHVGASWLTKENTLKETENVMRYFDAVFEAEQLPNDKNLIIFGYSQGVSVAMRYVAKRKLPCSQMVLHSGGIPKELTPEDFSFLNAKVTMIYGTKDEYLNEERIVHETQRTNDLFGNALEIIPFEGKHIVNVELINALV